MATNRRTSMAPDSLTSLSKTTLADVCWHLASAYLAEFESSGDLHVIGILKEIRLAAEKSAGSENDLKALDRMIAATGGGAR